MIDKVWGLECSWGKKMLEINRKWLVIKRKLLEINRKQSEIKGWFWSLLFDFSEKLCGRLSSTSGWFLADSHHWWSLLVDFCTTLITFGWYPVTSMQWISYIFSIPIADILFWICTANWKYFALQSVYTNCFKFNNSFK